MKMETGVWIAQAKEHYDDAQYLYEGSRYSMALYCCHQALEKILKAYLIEYKHILPPKNHKLDILAQQTGLDMPSEWIADLAEITRHFWRVRYPDYQQYVYSTRAAVDPTMTKTKEIYLWILTKLNQQ